MTRIELPAKKKVGHLTLLRRARQLTSREFNALDAAERLEMIRHSFGRHKYELILEAADAHELVPRLPAQEVFLLIKERGLEESLELLEMASTDQITTFIDLDCWDGDTFDRAAALVWLVALLETGIDKVLPTLREMDFGLLILLLKQFAHVSPPDPDEDIEVLKERLQTDRLFDVTFQDSETGKLLGGLFEYLQNQEREFWLQLMEGLCWDLDSELEEGVALFRRGRLQDRGFPDPFEAISVYAWLDPDAFRSGEEERFPMSSGEVGVTPPTFMLDLGRPKDLLADVLADGLEEERSWELAFLLNKVMLANKVDVGDAEAVGSAAGEVFRNLNLGLEQCAGGDGEAARKVWDATYFEHLFRLGFSLTLRLQRRARKIRASVIGPYLSGSLRSLVDGLNLKKPLLFTGLADEILGSLRPFANLEEVNLAAAGLRRLETVQRLFEVHFPFNLLPPEAMDMRGCLPAASKELTLSDIFLTALANRLLGRDFLPLPIPVAELSVLHGQVSEGGRLSAKLRQETREWLESLEPGGGEFGDQSLDVWGEEFCPLAAEDLDPRFLRGVMVRMKDEVP